MTLLPGDNEIFGMSDGQINIGIGLKEVSAGYGGTVILDRVSAELCKGEFVALIGANGAGKSTLLKVVSGDLAPVAGTVSIEGEPLAGMSRRELSRRVAVVNTDRIEAEALTVEETVGMGRYPYTGFFGNLDAADRRIVADALEATGMTRFARKNVARLSDGERQKVMIARALAQTTPVILLDEPTAFLDVASRVEVLSLLKRLARTQGRLVLMSLHDVSSALELADRVWMLPGDGSLLSGTPAGLVRAQQEGRPGNALDRLFAGRNVRFDAGRLDYRGI